MATDCAQSNPKNDSAKDDVCNGEVGEAKFREVTCHHVDRLRCTMCRQHGMEKWPLNSSASCFVFKVLGPKYVGSKGGVTSLTVRAQINS